MNAGHQAYYQKVIKEYFSKEEVSKLHEYSDWKALWEVAYNWLWIIAAFALVYFVPNVMTIIIALFIIGGKQLGCAIIMHDTGHKALFKSKRLNHFFGNWFGAFPIFMDMPAYGKYHLEHHLNVGLDEDPDTNLAKGYPAKPFSMLRKILRDLSGITGVKGFFGLMAMHAGFIEFELGGRVIKVSKKMSVVQRIALFFKNAAGPFLANAILFIILFALGQPLLYLLWIGAFLTTFYFCIRIRSITEHSMVPDTSNPALNTRSTEANFIEKLLFAPLNVNYHMEHHLMMSVPSYHLPRMHKILLEKSFFKEALSAQSYWEVFKTAIVKI